MTDGGTFKNINRTALPHIPRIGERLQLQLPKYTTVVRKPPLHHRWGKFSFIASLFLIVFLGVSLLFPSQGIDHVQGESYIVAIDINPSMELVLDKNGNVLSARGINSSGLEVVSAMQNLTNNTSNAPKTEKSLENYFNLMIREMTERGFFPSEDDVLVCVTIVELIQSEREDIQATIEQSITATLKEYYEEVEIILFTEVKDGFDKAKELELSVNQYKLYEQIKETAKEYGIELELDDIRNKPVSSLIQLGRELHPSSGVTLPNAALHGQEKAYENWLNRQKEEHSSENRNGNNRRGVPHNDGEHPGQGNTNSNSGQSGPENNNANKNPNNGPGNKNASNNSNRGPISNNADEKGSSNESNDVQSETEQNTNDSDSQNQAEDNEKNDNQDAANENEEQSSEQSRETNSEESDRKPANGNISRKNNN